MKRRVNKDVSEARIKIIKITNRLFREKGYANTSVNEICRKASISKGTFYYHFKSKEDLLFAFINDFLEDYYSELQKLLEKTDDPREKIRIIIEMSLDYLQPENINIVFWLSLLNESPSVKHRAGKYFDQMYEGFREEIAGYIKEGKQRKQFNKEINSSTASLFLTGVIEGTAIQILFDVDYRLNLKRIKRDTVIYIMKVLEV